VIGLAAAAASEAFRFLADNGSSIGPDVPACSPETLHELMGFTEIWEFEKRWSPDEG